jgi:hypothetical protein
MVMWYNENSSQGMAPGNGKSGFCQECDAWIFTPFISRGQWKKKEVAMGIRSSIHEAREAPKKAIIIATFAIIIASLALLVAMGKKG